MNANAQPSSSSSSLPAPAAATAPASVPVAGPSPPEAGPLPVKRGEIGYDPALRGASRSSSQRSGTTSQSARSPPFRNGADGQQTRPQSRTRRDRTASGADLLSAAEVEARLDARLEEPNSGRRQQPSSSPQRQSPIEPPAPARSATTGAGAGFVPRQLFTGRGVLGQLPRLPLIRTLVHGPVLPERTSSLPGGSSPEGGRRPILGFGSADPRRNKVPESRWARVLGPLIIWLLAAVLIAGTGVGYSVAIRINNQQVAAAQAAQASQPPGTVSSNQGNEGGFGTNTSAPFLHTFFILGLLFELTFLYRRTRALYIAWAFDPYYYYSPEAIQNGSGSGSGPSPRARRADHPRADNPDPAAVKSSFAGRWAKRAIEYILRVPQEKLRPREEVLPTYVAAMEVPAGWEPGQSSRMTREERRLRRTGSARGTGDAEDIEVERAWRMGGGRGLPIYSGDEMRNSVILLAGPAPTRRDLSSLPQTPGTAGSFGRLSRRISDGAQVLQRLSRRLSASLGMAPSTPTVSTPPPDGRSSSQSEMIGNMEAPKLRPPAKDEDDTPSPVRLSYHASVVLELEAAFEAEGGDEKDGLEVCKTTKAPTTPPAGPSSSAQYASYPDPTAAASSAVTSPSAVASPRRTSWTTAHHRRRSSGGSGSGSHPPPPHLRLPGARESTLARISEAHDRETEAVI